MISKKEVEHIAKLAHIQLAEGEGEKFQEELSQILESFDTLSRVDTEGVEPMTHSIVLENAVRDDEPRSPDAALVQNLARLARATREGFIKVKSVLKQ